MVRWLVQVGSVDRICICMWSLCIWLGWNKSIIIFKQCDSYSKSNAQKWTLLSDLWFTLPQGINQSCIFKPHFCADFQVFRQRKNGRKWWGKDLCPGAGWLSPVSNIHLPREFWDFTPDGMLDTGIVYLCAFHHGSSIQSPSAKPIGFQLALLAYVINLLTRLTHAVAFPTDSSLFLKASIYSSLP